MAKEDVNRQPTVVLVDTQPKLAVNFVVDVFGFEPIPLGRSAHSFLDYAAGRDLDEDITDGSHTHIEAIVRSMLGAPEICLGQPNASREKIYPFIIPEIFQHIHSLNPQLQTAVIRYCLTYSVGRLGFDITSDPADWLSGEILRELAYDGVRKTKVTLDATIESILHSTKIDFDGLAAPALTPETWERNRRAILNTLSALEKVAESNVRQDNTRAGEIVDYFVRNKFSLDSFVSYISLMQSAIASAKSGDTDNLSYILRFLSTSIYYLLNSEEFIALSGFTDDYQRKGLENVCTVGRFVCSINSQERRPIPLEELLGKDYTQAAARFPGIEESLLILQKGLPENSQVKIWEVQAQMDGKDRSYYIIRASGNTGRKKIVFVPTDNPALVLASLEQCLFFLEDNDFGPNEHIQVMGAVSADEGGQALGLALGDCAFFSTEGALSYGGTREARRKHEEHERRHLEYFSRWPSLRKMLIDPHIFEGMLYAQSNRVDAELLFYVLQTPEEKLSDIWLRPWNTELNGAKYSFAYLVWDYIKARLAERGLSLINFFDEMENVKLPLKLDNDFRVRFAVAVARWRHHLGIKDPPDDAFSTGSYDACVVEALNESLTAFQSKLGQLESLFGRAKRKEIEMTLQNIASNPNIYWQKLASLLVNKDVVQFVADNNYRIVREVMMSLSLPFESAREFIAYQELTHELITPMEPTISIIRDKGKRVERLREEILSWIFDSMLEVITKGAVYLSRNGEKESIIPGTTAMGRGRDYMFASPYTYIAIEQIMEINIAETLADIEESVGLTRDYIRRWGGNF